MVYKLCPGDIMLFKPTSLFGQLIRIKTWHNVSHVEIYRGAGQSDASRDGIGVGTYPVRTSGLVWVLRPKVPLDIVKGLTYTEELMGTPYGWVDLLNFAGIPLNRRGIVCSPFAAGWLRAAGWDVFPEDPIECVAPFQFLDLVGDECGVAYDLRKPLA